MFDSVANYLRHKTMSWNNKNNTLTLLYTRFLTRKQMANKMLATNPLGSTSYRFSSANKNGEVVLFGNSARLSIKRRSKVRDKSLNCLQLRVHHQTFRGWDGRTGKFKGLKKNIEVDNFTKNHLQRLISMSCVKLQCFNSLRILPSTVAFLRSRCHRCWCGWEA